jgi:hypothetical protein
MVGKVVTGIDVVVLCRDNVLIVARCTQVFGNGTGDGGATDDLHRAALAEVVLHVDDDQRSHTLHRIAGGG